MTYTIVTGASQNHRKTLKQFIDSFLRFYRNDDSVLLVVYDLGIDDFVSLKTEYEMVKNIVYDYFDFGVYPTYFDINVNAGEYAWKPVILHNVCEKFGGKVVWMDSGNVIHCRLDQLYQFLDVNGIHTGLTSGTITDWTHPKTLTYMNCEKEHLMLQNRNGACVGVNYDIDWVKDFVKEWKDNALDKNCIAPDGSSRANHRQDQAVLSVMFYRYQNKYKFGSFDNNHWKFFLGYSIHNDCD
jgi:hypothetical protein